MSHRKQNCQHLYPVASKIKIQVQGQVQGVGFRPFVFRLAKELGLKGEVKNSPAGVEICLQGDSQVLEDFWNRLHHDLPPLAKITKSNKMPLDQKIVYHDFKILESTSGTSHQVLISPDIAICEDCLQELLDPENRRYLYPFTNCTNCGPRLTITSSIPYDRASTSMACFPMCAECAKEYNDPTDRRFHAQPNACAWCGPKIWLENRNGQIQGQGNQALEEAARLLTKDHILAIKGLGGFHLVCRATSNQAVRTLRERKKRPAKPLAIMVPDLDTAHQLCSVSKESANWLTGPIKPIVLCPQKQWSRPEQQEKKYSSQPPKVSSLLAPDTNFLGVMLPYTPLHVVLLKYYQNSLKDNELPVLVMTSGNSSAEPIALGNREAKARLQDIADFFLFHDRDILIRCDDSVLSLPSEHKAPLFYRRARGFVPNPIQLTQKGPCVLGAGAEKKSTICLTKNEHAFVSQYIGDLKNLKTYNFFKQTIQHFIKILQTEPQVLVADLHPDYLSTRYAQEQGKKLFLLQHHFAHIFAVLAEHRFQGPALGLALDGTGLGQDKTLWGGELLLVNTLTLEQQRLGHLARIKLPGGETAIANPWRIALSLLYALDQLPGKNKVWSKLQAELPETKKALPIVLEALDKDINCPSTSSCGRLFDGVSALLGLCPRVSYEGQAAIILEKIQDLSIDKPYACPALWQEDHLVLDTLTLFAQVASDWKQGISPEEISRRFHLGLINGLVQMAKKASTQTGIKTIALSGGVFQNQTISTLLPSALENAGLQFLIHRQLPPNDGCISLGQAAYGQQKILLTGSPD